ncbi:MAG: antibiotic biosynthesis monooxygenase [Leptolyngbyaceae cyanobacterium SU_3_3]|nr:antibiotic biosynthesis monooxygenase [Leptolyngbyaceae cyanobacterium SU_3_3]
MRPELKNPSKSPPFSGIFYDYTTLGRKNMNSIALIVRHKAKPGMRENMRATWEAYVKPNAQSNPEHLACYFCYDSDNSDGITAFQIFTSAQAKEEFLKSEWYPDYLTEVSKFISEPPQITTAEIMWNKNEKGA